MIDKFARAFHDRESTALTLLTYGIAVNGLAIIALPMLATLLAHHAAHFYNVRVSFDLESILGLTLLYLSGLVRRRKRTAWTVTMLLYMLILVSSLLRLDVIIRAPHWHGLIPLISNVLLPLAVVSGLGYYHQSFTVKSDIRSFALTLRFAVLVMMVTFAYGIIGFTLMDQHDFHHEITLVEAAHRTIDQFGLTTDHDLVPYTRRAHAFTDSLSILSIGSVAYVFISLFQPIRAHLVDQEPKRKKMKQLLEEFPASSEDFFKLWPHDKIYFFNQRQTASLAYGVRGGMALVVGDPCGNPRHFDKLLDEFDEYCRINDWSPVMVHTEPRFTELYKRHGFNLQKIGEEAVLDLGQFMQTTRSAKYFRQIRNRFTKLEYTAELLMPPHSAETIARLQAISQEWLSRPGRAERTFMMGYFSAEYVQQAPVMVLRDAAGQIQAFINQIPSFDPDEANFDMLRHAQISTGNSNDYILMCFIEALHAQGFKRLNLGLCPLSGLDEKDTPNDEPSVINGALRFMYANGDRFYSFSGLRRFKAKYEPNWSSRYIAYRGRVGAFTKALNALNRAMKP